MESQEFDAGVQVVFRHPLLVVFDVHVGPEVRYDIFLVGVEGLFFGLSYLLVHELLDQGTDRYLIVRVNDATPLVDLCYNGLYHRVVWVCILWKQVPQVAKAYVEVLV